MNQPASGPMVTTKTQIDESACYRWDEPNSDITVCLKVEAVDRLQLDVLRGIDSRPEKLEVGGILLGTIETSERGVVIVVDDFEPVYCEHGKGPFYELTAEDLGNLEAALAWARTRRGMSAVGYYRSHNRPGLFLSSDDLGLIRRYFNTPDNLFLLIKTLPKRACTAGFFFWKNGQIQSEFTDSEAPLIPRTSSPEDARPAADEAVAEITVAPPFERAPPLEPAPPIVFSTAGRRRWVRGTVVAGVAAAAVILALAVVHYRTPRRALQPRTISDVPLVANNSIPAAAAKSEPELPAKPAVATIPAAPETPRSRERSQTPPAPRVEAKPAAPSPAPKAAIADPPFAGERSTPRVTKALVAPPEPTISPAPAIPADLPTSPAAPVTSLPSSIVPPTAASVPPPPEVRATAPPKPVPSPAVRTFVGPQVTHQVSPAVPRGVGPKITSDVELDVEVTIDEKGKVTRARVVSTKGSAAGLLAIEALKAAQLYRFQPAQENGHNVESVMILTFRFDRIAK